MRARVSGALVVGAVIVTLGGATSQAQAKPGYLVYPKNVRVTMVVPGSNGYRIAIGNTGHRLIRLVALKGDLRAEYAVRGHASRHGIYARFGKLGRIAVKFDGSPRPLRRGRPPLLKCKGGPAIREVGRFKGSIRFSGELGYTSVSASRARGSVVRGFRRVCKRPPWLRPRSARLSGKGGGKRPSATIFAAASRAGHRLTLLGTVGVEIPGRSARDSLFIGFDTASVLEQRGRISIRRTAFVDGGPGDVLAGEPGLEPASGTISLPRPFHGTATYSKPAGEPATLTGSLVVRLPGTDAVPLAGPDFKAALCRTINEKPLSRCMREVTKELGPKLAVGVSGRVLQGSGSHSQPFELDRLSWSR